MYSISFPNMFTSTSTKVVKDKDATDQNLKLLLCSNKGAFTFDPEFGADLGELFFELDDADVIPELVIDKIVTSIQRFMPQLIIKRKDITMTHYGRYIDIDIKAYNKFDAEIDNYTLKIVSGEDSSDAV